VPIAELVTIGREILDGRVVDTNAVKMAQALRTIGLIPRYGQRVDDQIDRVVEAFQIADGRSDLILVTGGLGPTSDDLTAAAFGKFLGEKLEFREDALKQIAEYLKRVGREVTPQILAAQRKQAMLPPSCFVLPNLEGTAPGFALERSGKGWYFMPGVPREMLRMLTAEVVPRLPARTGYQALTWVTQFTAESQLQARLTPLEAKLPPDVEITYQTSFPENHIGLCGEGITEELCAEMDRLLGADAWCRRVPIQDLKSIDEVVTERLAFRSARVRILEEGTGGLLASRFHATVKGADIFAGGVVLPVPLVGTALPAWSETETGISSVWIRLEPNPQGATVHLGFSGLGMEPVTEKFVITVRFDATRMRIYAVHRAFDFVRRSVELIN